MLTDFRTSCKRLLLRAKIAEARLQLEPEDQRMIDLVLDILEAEEPINVSEIARAYSGRFSTIYGQIGHALVKMRDVIRQDREWMEEHGFDPDRSEYNHNPVSRLVALS